MNVRKYFEALSATLTGILQDDVELNSRHLFKFITDFHNYL